MEESDFSDLEVKALSLIDFSSENDSLIGAASSSSVTCGLSDPQSSETQYEPRSFELSGGVDDDKVAIMAHTNGWSKQLPLIPETSELERTRKNDKCNLRKSLAWDSSFFTSVGVLDAEELSSMIEGGQKGEKHILPGIEEDIQRSTDSISTLDSDNLTLESIEAELFGDIRASIQKSSKAFNVANSSSKEASGETNIQVINHLKKVDLTSRNRLKPNPASKNQTIGMQVSGKTIRQGYGNPQVTQSIVRIGDSASSFPRPPKLIGRANPIATGTKKRASLGANRVKIENDNAKSTTVGSKGTQASRATGLVGPRRIVPKPASSSSASSTATKTEPTRSYSSCDSSGSASPDNIGKSPSTSARRKVDSRTVNPASSGSISKTLSKIPLRKNPSENSGLSTHLMSSKLSSSSSPASSISEWSSESSSSTSTVNQRAKSRASLDTSSSCRSLDSDAPPALGLNTNSNCQFSDGNENQVPGLPSQLVKKASTQIGTLSRPASMKPSGLRMPSPKIGFFDGAKSVVRTPNGGMQSQSRLPNGLPKIGAGICSPIGSSNTAKSEKLPSTLTVTPIANTKPCTQKSASPRPLSTLSKIASASRGVKSYPSVTPEVQDNIGGISCVKAEEIGTEGSVRAQHITDPGLDAEKNRNLGGLTNIQGIADLKMVKIAPTDGDICVAPESCSKEHFVYGQGESLTNLSTATTRTPFAVKDSFYNTEGFDFSSGSSIEVVEKMASLPSSEICQKENN